MSINEFVKWSNENQGVVTIIIATTTAVVGWITGVFKFLWNYASQNHLNPWRKKYDKSNSHILFIDDDYFPVINNLKKNGWAVTRVNDITDIDDLEIKRAQIIFVDYKGVGKVLYEEDEGVGVIKAIKKKYGRSKRVILYSGYNKPLILGSKIGDNQLSKNSNTYEFVRIIETELTKI